MPTYLLPTEEDTKIELTFADGQEPLTIDALDVDNLITDVHVKGIPEDSDFYTMYIETFKSKYKRKLSSPQSICS